MPHLSGAMPAGDCFTGLGNEDANGQALHFPGPAAGLESWRRRGEFQCGRLETRRLLAELGGLSGSCGVRLAAFTWRFLEAIRSWEINDEWKNKRNIRRVRMS